MALSERRARLIGRLTTRKTREREGLVLVEGERAVREAVAAGAELRFALITDRLEPALGAELRAVAAADDVIDVSGGVLRELSATERPSGVLAVFAQPGAAEAGGARLLVLDAVQDPGNVGTLIRSAAAFGWDGVVCLDGTVDPWGAKTVRASAGTVFRIPVSQMPAGEATIAWTTEGRTILVADAEGAPAADVVVPYALVLGNEGAGPRPEIRESAGSLIAVQMGGGVESLNVAVAGSILMHDLTTGAHT